MAGIDFSIVIPAYNSLALLQRALASVRRQQGVVWEAVIVDDSDEGDTIGQYIATLRDPHVVYRHNSPPLGAVANWNSGLAMCRGSNVMLLHHDEELRGDDYLLNVMRHLEGHELVVSNIEVHHSDGRVYGLAPAWVKRCALRMPAVLIAVNVFGPCAVVAFRREAMLPFDTLTRWFVDVEWYYRMLRRRRGCYIPSSTVVSHHGHSGQITGRIDAMAEAARDAAVLRRKYRANIAVRAALWLHISVIHNTAVNRIIKRILRR